MENIEISSMKKFLAVWNEHSSLVYTLGVHDYNPLITLFISWHVKQKF